MTFIPQVAVYLKRNNYWQPLVNTLKFLLHFLVVMALMYCGAVIFAHLEDPDVDAPPPLHINNNITGNYTRGASDASGVT